MNKENDYYNDKAKSDQNFNDNISAERMIV